MYSTWLKALVVSGDLNGIGEIEKKLKDVKVCYFYPKYSQKKTIIISIKKLQ